MKKVLIILLMSGLLAEAGAQGEFRGSIRYGVSVQVRDTALDAKALKAQFGNETLFHFAHGSWFQEYRGALPDFDFLDLRDKTYGIKYKGNDTLFISDATRFDDAEILARHILKDSVLVAGQLCQQIDYQVRDLRGDFDYRMRMAFSDNILVNPNDFRDIEYGFMKEVYSGTACIPLGITYQYPGYELVLRAKEINHDAGLNLAPVLREHRDSTLVHLRH